MQIRQLLKSSYAYILIILISVLYGLLYSLPQYFYIFAINNLLKGRLQFFFYWQVLQFLIGFLADGVLAANTVLFERSVQRFMEQTRTNIVNNYYFANYESLSDIENDLTRNINYIKENKLDNIFKLVTQVSVMIFSLFFISSISYKYMIIIVFLGLCTLFAPKIMEKVIQASMKDVSNANQKFIESISSWLSGLHELTTFNSLNILKQAIGNSSSNLEKSTVKNSQVTNLSLFINGTVNSVCQMAVLGLGSFLYFGGHISLGSWAAANDFSFAIFSSILVITNLLTKISSVKDIDYKVTKMANKIDDPHSVVQKMPASIATHDLVYKCDDKEFIFPNFEVKLGQKILIDAPSGEGKTTLLKLILGELKPTSGEITYFDESGKIINPDFSSIGYIPQQAQIFPGSVLDNVTMFDNRLETEALHAVKKLGLKLDAKLLLAANGNNISGGEKQRIILARSQVHSKRLLLSDEGLSAIDDSSVTKIINRMLSYQSMAVIMVEHNLTESQKSMFDSIIHLNERKKLD